MTGERRPVCSRLALVALALLLALAAHAAAAPDATRPIVFVHGNGDSAALWVPTIWRFESNGWPRSMVVAIDFTHPVARSDDAKPQDNRGSTADELAALAALVAEVQQRAGGTPVALVGSSRGGYAIRNFVKHGGVARVSHLILAGVPNHGVWSSASWLPGSEFNAAGPFLTALNAGPEVEPGVRTLVIRSDTNDKYAQPDGRFIGRPGQPTHVTYAGPELAGATTVVLAGLDHREVAFHAQAFRAMYVHLTGHEPATLDVLPEAQPVLDGVVSGWASGAPTNVPLAGATVEVYEVDPGSGQRVGEAVHHHVVGADGHWGPFPAKGSAYYEFVVTAEGYPITHVYHTPFPRSTAYAHLRLRPLDEKDRQAGAVVRLVRPRGYLGPGRDRFLVDGTAPAGVPTGVPSTDSATVRLPAGPARPVHLALNGERMTVLSYPAPEHLVIGEFWF